MNNIYSVRDESAQYFLPPFIARTDSQAQRMFIGSLGDSFPYRRDFQLYCVGSFDEDNGTIETENPPRIVLAGLSIDESLDPRQHIDRTLPEGTQFQEREQ